MIEKDFKDSNRKGIPGGYQKNHENVNIIQIYCSFHFSQISLKGHRCINSQSNRQFNPVHFNC